MTQTLIDASGPACAATLAAKPRVLMIATMPWVFPARLGKALCGAGFHVEAVCQVGHYLRYLSTPIPVHRLGWFREAASIAAAIERSKPDLLVACDDPAVAILHGLHRRTGPGDMAALIERSLGKAASFDVTSKRTALIALVRSMGPQVPRSENVTDCDALAKAARRMGYPCVLKRDQTWSGIGVAVLRSDADLQRAWSWTVGNVSLLRAAKAVLRDRRPRTLLDLIGSEKPRVELQEFVPGAPANRAVVCREGRVIAGVSALALQTAYPGGPASLVRIIHHPQMANVVEAVVDRLGLSGFCGFDFIMKPCGEAVLLELNPRSTPTCHLGLGDGTHLPSALFSELTGRQPQRSFDPIRGHLVALFPTEWQRDRSGASLRATHHDAPFDEPALMAKAGFAQKTVPSEFDPTCS